MGICAGIWHMRGEGRVRGRLAKVGREGDMGICGERWPETKEWDGGRWGEGRGGSAALIDGLR